MKSWIAVLFLIVSSLVKAQASTHDCDLTTKLKAPFVSCHGLKGYGHPDEWVTDAQIAYKNVDGKEETLSLAKKVQVKDLLSSGGIAKILSDHGVKNFKDAKMKRLSIDKDFPLYKDPEASILASGCQMDGAPVVVSYDKKLACQDFVCIATVECKSGSKKKYKDAACKGEVQKDGVTCPSASECLKDQYVSVEDYIPAGKNNSSNKPSSSGAAQQ